MKATDLFALRLRLRAREPVELPCLPTVAVRSVFGMALRQLTCLQPDRSACSECPHADGCAYVTLFEPVGAAARNLGVTDGAPPPLVLAPEAPTADEAPLRLSKGGRLDLRVVLVGEARVHASLVVAAMRAGLGRGVGRERAAMELEEAQPMDVTLASPGAAAEIELCTPLRLTSQGKVRSRFAGPDFVQGVVRRQQTLAKLYCRADELGELEDGAVQLEATDTRVVHVRRWSSRQKSTMDLPGLVGRLLLRGELAGIWPWLALGEWLHVGKGTSMGFGRYRLRAVG